MIVGADNKARSYGDAKDVTFRSSGNPKQYCILRVDRKFYNLESVEGFEYHMERKGQVENADRTKSYENRILIGDANVYENLNQHIKNCWIRKGSCIARDMVLTASNSFFQGLSKDDFEKWLSLNVEWLEKTYSKNVIYCVLHMDETTPHLHILVSPIYTNEKGNRVMSNKHYFDGKDILSEIQSNYALHIQNSFKSLSRGLKGSKASHVSIKQYYELCSKKLDEKDMESIMAKAKNNELVEIKLDQTKKTLNYYQGMKVKDEKENEVTQKQNILLWQNLKEMKKENELYKEGIKILSKFYEMPEQKLIDIINYSNKKEKEIEHEL